MCVLPKENIKHIQAIFQKNKNKQTLGNEDNMKHEECVKQNLKCIIKFVDICTFNARRTAGLQKTYQS